AHLRRCRARNVTVAKCDGEVPADRPPGSSVHAVSVHAVALVTPAPRPACVARHGGRPGLARALDEAVAVHALLLTLGTGRVRMGIAAHAVAGVVRVEEGVVAAAGRRSDDRVRERGLEPLRVLPTGT